MGLEFTGNGLNLNLGLPLDSYRFESPLVGVVKTKGRYEGWYAPSQPGNWTVQIRLPQETGRRVLHVEANGRRLPPKSLANGMIEIVGPSTLTKPLRWALVEQ